MKCYIHVEDSGLLYVRIIIRGHGPQFTANIQDYSKFSRLQQIFSHPRWLSGLRRSHVHSMLIARRSLRPEKLGSNPGQGSKGINFSGWHGLDMSITVTKRR